MALTLEEIKIRLGVDASAIGAQLNGATQKLAAWGRNLAGVFIGGSAMGKFIEMFDRLDKRIDNIKRTAEKSGLGTDFTQDLMNVGKLAGISGEEIEGMMDGFVKHLKPGEEPATKLKQIADQLSRTSDAGERAAIAIDAFGKAGIKMIPILSQGADAVERLSSSMGKLSAEQILEIDAINDSVETAKTQADNWFATIISGGYRLFQMRQHFAKGMNLFDRLSFVVFLGSQKAKDLLQTFYENEGEAAVKAANDAFDAAHKLRLAAIMAEHDAQMQAAGNAAAWLEKKDKERDMKRSEGIQKIKLLELDLADLRHDLGNMSARDGNTPMEIAEVKDAIAEKEGQISSLKSKLPQTASGWTAFAGDPRKESMAKYYEGVGKSLGPKYGKVFTDRASALRDSESRTMSDGTVQKQMIGEAFFDALESSKKTPQPVIIKAVEE